MRFLNRRIFLLAFASLFSAPTFAQDEIDKLLSESLSDGKKLIGAYVDPFMKSVSLGLNQGWYNTAKPHKIVGVDLTVTVSAMTIPQDELLFDTRKLNLQQVELAPSSPQYPNAPTLVGPDITPTFRMKDQTQTQTFEGPPGLDLEGNVGKAWIPVPMAHLGIGLPKSTDLKIRFTPSIDLGNNGSLKIIGFGVMHDIKQWIPGIKLLPFDLAGFVGYTNFKLETTFDDGSVQGQGQNGIFEMNATTLQGVISKKFSVVTFYGGVGYNIAKSNLAMKGWYDVDEDGVKDSGEVNPLDLKFAASGPRATLGMRLKLAVLTLHADYTVQKYKCLSVGLGISVR
jgi:hypothetical protein